MPDIQRKGPESSSSQRKIAKIEKMHLALERRKEGVRLKAIAEELGVCYSTARNYVLESLQNLIAETQEFAAEYRQLEDLRMDDMLSAIYSRALSGDIPAINTAMNISKERRKLHGLDAPIKIEATLPPGGPVMIDDANLDRLTTDELLELRRLSLLLAAPAEVIDAEFTDG